MKKTIHYPFSAILGNNDLLLSIIINIINPKIGGLLIKGPKGSGKSTSVYSITDILPDIKIIKGCKFNCNPNKPEFWCENCLKKYKNTRPPITHKNIEVCTIPIGISEERLLGHVDIERLLNNKKYEFVPGLLSKANRQILYIDEVNLLPDYLTDEILDVLSTGINKIERENFSFSHYSHFLLFGTMNPEEGELRPQLLDRFPLSVNIKNIDDKETRKKIIKRNIAYKDSPKDFISKYKKVNNKLKYKIIEAKSNLKNIIIEEDMLDIIADLCSYFEVDGFRPDIYITQTAITLSSLENNKKVEPSHILKAAKFVLMHRTRKGGFLQPLNEEDINEFFKKNVDQIKNKNVFNIANFTDNNLNSKVFKKKN